MADENEQDEELTEIIVTAPDHGGGGGGGGGGGDFGIDIWGGWDTFIWSGGSNGPDGGGGGEPEASPEIVVTAPEQPPPTIDLNEVLAVVADFLTYDDVADFIGYYRLRVTVGENPEIQLDILNDQTQNIDTYVISETGAFQYSNPNNEIPAHPDQPFTYTGPQEAPELWNWA